MAALSDGIEVMSSAGCRERRSSPAPMFAHPRGPARWSPGYQERAPLKRADAIVGLHGQVDAGTLSSARASAPPESRIPVVQVTAASGVAPRFIRLRDAPRYFGMDKNLFNRAIRPRLTVIRIGVQGRAFDRLEMDLAAEEYKSRNGIPAALSTRKKPLWEIEKRQVSPSAEGSGTSTRNSEALAFAKALELATCGKLRSISPSG